MLQGQGPQINFDKRQLVQLVAEDPNASNQQKVQLAKLLNSAEFVNDLFSGTSGMLLLFSLGQLLSMPKEKRTSYALYGIGGATLLLHALNKQLKDETQYTKIKSPYDA